MSKLDDIFNHKENIIVLTILWLLTLVICSLIFSGLFLGCRDYQRDNQQMNNRLNDYKNKLAQLTKKEQ